MRHLLLILALGVQACSHEPEPQLGEAWQVAESQPQVSEIDAEIFSLEDGNPGWIGGPDYFGTQYVHRVFVYPREWARSGTVPRGLPADPSYWYVLLPKEFTGTPKDQAFQLPADRKTVNYTRDWAGPWGKVVINSHLPGVVTLQLHAAQPVPDPTGCFQLTLFNDTTRVDLPVACGEARPNEFTFEVDCYHYKYGRENE